MQRIRLLGLFVAVLFAIGCPGEKPRAKIAPADDEGGKKDPNFVRGPSKGKGDITRIQTFPKRVNDFADVPEVVPELPKATAEDLYEAALHQAVDALADRKYKDALAALEKARSIKDTGTVQREIDKIQTVLAQQEAADKAVTDVKTVLDDGKADEAAKLANEALGQYGGGDKAEELTRLKQQADAVVTATADSNDTRRGALKAEAEAALKAGNLRTGAVALEQAVALGEDAALSKQLEDVRDRLRTYDENRRRALELRRDPAQLETALARLRDAKQAWETLQVQQEIDECTLIVNRRRDRITVADFEVRGDVGVPGAGRLVADELMPHFRPRFDLAERGQVYRVLDELKLEASDVAGSQAARQELTRLARVRYLVVGSLTPLAGVTAHARLIEVPTGLIVQTARISAPDIAALQEKLRHVAVMLQMTDEQKLSYEAECQRKAATVVVKPYEAVPVEFTPPPEAPVASAPPPPAIVTYTPLPPAAGGLVVQDFRPLQTAVVVVAPPPPPLALVLRQDDPHRHRLLRLSLDLGDNLFRRGQYRDAQRHFSVALSLAGPRREVSLRLDACRRFVPPPPPVVVLPPPVGTPVAAPPVVYTPVARPRVAVFGFQLFNCPESLVPPRASELLADQFASYAGGSYDIIDRGEVCWYMGRLGLTMKDVVTNEVSRRCLAQALGARYFVFGLVNPTASFDVETHLVDADTGFRAGTGKIHVQNLDEMKVRMGELARQVGARPADQAAMAKQGQQSEEALKQARSLVKDKPSEAIKIAQAGLQQAPDSVALQRVLAEAQDRQRLLDFEEKRRQEVLLQGEGIKRAKVRQEQLAKAAAEAATKAAAQKPADDTARKAQKQRAASVLREQAKQASAKGDYARAVQLLRGAASMAQSTEVDRELAQAQVAKEKADAKRTLAEQKNHQAADLAAREAALKKAAEEKTARDRVQGDARNAQEVRDQRLYDTYLKQAQTLISQGKFDQAIAAAEAARRIRPGDESARVLAEARDKAAVAGAKSATEKAKVEEEAKQRQATELKLKQDRENYLAAMKKGQEAVLARKYDDAVASYEAAVKFFRTDAALNSLKSARDLQKREQDRVASEKAKVDAEKLKASRVDSLLSQARTALAAQKHDEALKALRNARTLDPDNVAVRTELSRAVRERDAWVARDNADKARKARQAEAATLVRTGETAYGKKQFKDALAVAEKALALDPTSAEARSLQARARTALTTKTPIPPVKTVKPNPQIKEDYDLAMSAGRGAMKKGDFQGAIHSFNEALRKIPEDPAAKAGLAEAVRQQSSAYAAAMKRGQDAAKAGKTAEARTAFDEALKVKPKDPEATRARAELDRPKPPDPATARREALQKALTAARAAVRAGDFEAAVRSFDEALKLAPDDKAILAERTTAAYSGWVQKGNAALAAKKFMEARTAFDAALKLKPGDQTAIDGKKKAEAGLTPPPNPTEEAYRKALAQARTAYQEKKYAEAVKAYDEALKARPNDRLATAERGQAAYQMWLQYGNAALAGRKFAEARSAFDEALKIKPGDADAVKGKKAAEDGLKPPPVNPKKAEPKKVDPKKPAAPAKVSKETLEDYKLAMGAGELALRKKDYAGAVNSYKEAVRLIPGDKAATDAHAYAAWMRKGDDAMKEKKYADAVKAFDEALKLRPGDQEGVKAKKEAAAELGKAVPKAPAVKKK